MTTLVFTMTPHSFDTIAALATAPGRGGIAVIRVSGKDVKKITQAMLNRSLTPRHVTHLNFLDDNNKPIDSGIALYFETPNSFTGEDLSLIHI